MILSGNPGVNGPGITKIGNYEVLRKLGEGATSAVYLAQDNFNSRQVAVKLVSLPAAGEQGRRPLMHRLFLNEAALAGRLHHPHIAQIYDAVADADQTYIVMEYVAGGTLSRFTRSDNLLVIGDVIDMACKAANALEFASQHGVIHRDIKPANILVGESADIKVTDFGSASILRSASTLVEGIGTPAYMSPEQHLGRPLNPQSDIYSLGVVMFQLLTGHLHFAADNIAGLICQIVHADPPPPSAIRPEIPAEIDAVVLRALARDTAVRHSSWTEFAAELAAIASGVPLPRHGVLDTEKFNTLRMLSFFRSFGDVELWEVLRLSEWVDAGPDEIFIREDECGDFFAIIVSGVARVTRGGRTLRLLRSGDCVGEMAYPSGARSVRSPDVMALTPLRMVRFGVPQIERASELCRLHFERTCQRILVERLVSANSGLAGV